MKTITVLAGASTLSICLAMPVLADDTAAPVDLVFSGSVGVVTLEANEYVYPSAGSADLLSKLIWKSTAPMATLAIDLGLPQNWTLSAKAMAAIDGGSIMDDYDWTGTYFVSYDEKDWTHHSVSENTHLDWYFNGNLLLGYNVIAEDDVTVNVNGGFEYTDVQWAAVGGSYVYSETGYRADVGNFPNTPAITYRQQFPSAVIGVDGKFEQDGWTFEAGAKAGLTFNAKGIDDHWLRSLRFEDTLNSAALLAANVGMSYEVSDNLSVFFNGTVEKIFNNRGNETATDTTSGATVFSATDIVGADLFSASASIGLKGKF